MSDTTRTERKERNTAWIWLVAAFAILIVAGILTS